MRDAESELRSLEPIFHRPETSADFDAMMAPDFWEVGASGRIYTRAEVLATLAERYADPRYDPTAGMVVSDFSVRQLAPDLWLATYHLLQQERPTRRVSVWRLVDGGWQLLYHQGGTVVT